VIKSEIFQHSILGAAHGDRPSLSILMSDGQIVPEALRCNPMPKESVLVFLSKPLVTRQGHIQGTDFSRDNDPWVSDSHSQTIEHLVGGVRGRHVAHTSQYFSAKIDDGG
jgi:hypothetical protein